MLNCQEALRGVLRLKDLSNIELTGKRGRADPAGSPRIQAGWWCRSMGRPQGP